MPPFRSSMLMMAVCAALTSQAAADATEIAIEAKLDRNPSNFDIPKDTKIKIDAAHAFANGVILGGSLETTIDVGSGEVTYDLETTLGYKWKVNDIFSLRGSAGIGERFQPASTGRQFSLLRAVYWLRYRLEREMDVECYHVPFSRRLRHEQRVQHAGSFHAPQLQGRRWPFCLRCVLLRMERREPRLPGDQRWFQIQLLTSPPPFSWSV